nr:type II toxin-antitoxin system RelE/ParE family toxin [Microcystis wesenbergii]
MFYLGLIAHLKLIEVQLIDFWQKSGSSRLCVIIFAYVRLNVYWARLLGLFCGRNYQYRPRFHTETRRAKVLNPSIQNPKLEIVNFSDLCKRSNVKYQIQFKPKAIKDLEKMSSQERTRIMAKIEAMKDNLQGDVKQLKNFTPNYRLRVGNYRILFEVGEITLVIYRVKHRQNAYT